VLVRMCTTCPGIFVAIVLDQAEDTLTQSK
jgi:hypothetical protein